MTATGAPDVEMRVKAFVNYRRRNKLLSVIGVLGLIIGLGAVAGGVGGAVYTWNRAEAAGLTTPDDASIPGSAVRGPFTMRAEADALEQQQLDRTGGLRYPELPDEVAALDEAGKPVLDSTGEAVMVANQDKAAWVTTISLVSALELGVVSYALSLFAVLVGLTLMGCGTVFLALRAPRQLLG
jgi:hypothetical protein